MLQRDNLIGFLKRTEKKISSHRYYGRGNKQFNILEGTIPVIISAPHAVNQFRKGELKFADKLTGSFALALHELTGCHVIYSAKYFECDPNYDPNPNGENKYQEALKDYIVKNDIKVLLDIHGASKTREYSIEMGTAPIKDEFGNIIGESDPSIHGNKFIIDLIKYSFEFVLKNSNSIKPVSKNVVFNAGEQNTVTKYISENTSCNCVQLEINGAYRDFDNREDLLKFFSGLKMIVDTLGSIDWNSPNIHCYRLWQSSTHKPLDKVERICSVNASEEFSYNRLLYICTSNNTTAMVWIRHPNQFVEESVVEQISSYCNSIGYINYDVTEYLLLTNRLIELLFGRKWSDKNEDISFLGGAPLILYEASKDTFPIGLPRADQLDVVNLSTVLYKKVAPELSKYNFLIYNRYSDSRLFLNNSKLDYGDNGRVKDAQGQPAMKIMLPRYFRRLMGYVEAPIEIIRSEVFERNNQLILSLTRNQLSEIEKRFSEEISRHDYKQNNELYPFTSQRIVELFKICYKVIPGEVFYELNQDCDKSLIQFMGILQKSLGMFDNVDLLRVPIRNNKKDIGVKSIISSLNKWILTLMIGKVDYYLKTEWTSGTDDKNRVARLSPYMMNLLGVSENDKIVALFGDNKATLSLLSNKALSNYQIGLPASARKCLDMNSINDIVVVHRDMAHALKRKSQAQLLAFLGTLFTILKFNLKPLITIILCITIIPIALYFVLNEERIRVK